MLSRALFGIILMCICIIACMHLPVTAQDREALHTYQQELVQATTDTGRINALRKMGTVFLNSDPDTAIVLTMQALHLANKIAWTKGIAQCGLNLCSYFQNSGKYDSSLKYANLALTAALEVGDKNRIALVYINRGTLFTIISKYEEALEDLKAAVLLSEEIKSDDRLARASTSICQLYMYQENWEAALPWALKALELQTKLGNTQQVAVCKINLAGLYLKKKDFQAAEDHLLNAYSIAEQLNDILSMINAAMSLGDLYQQTDNLAGAIYYLKKAVAGAEQINSDHHLGSAYFDLGNAYFESRQYQPALQSYQSGWNAVAGKEELQLEQQYNLNGLAQTYYATGDYKKGYEMLQQSMILKDTLNQRLNNKKLLELQTQFETSQKDKEIILLNKSKQLQQEEALQQRLLKNVFIAGAVLLLLIVGLLWNRYQLKQRTATELAAKNVLIEEARQRAEKSEQFKSQFLANMSHEIRTPMNAVIGTTNLLLDEPQEEKNKKYLSVIRHASENLLVIINDILDLSKLEAGMMTLETIPYSLHDLVYAVRDMLQFKADEKGLKLLVQIDPAIPAVLIGDPTRLTQILMNLAGNAVKFTETGSVMLSVMPVETTVKTVAPGWETVTASDNSLTESKQGDAVYLKFAVSDTGIGIEPSAQKKIFESFSQASSDDARRFGGTGLGLTISQNLVQLMGGKLEVESELHSGSVFSFEIRQGIGTTDQLSNFQLERDGYTADDLFGLRILLAEDNEHNQMVTIDTIKKLIEEVKIDLVTTGMAVLEKLKQHTGTTVAYDVILMDVQMPEMDGYEATRIIRSSFPEPLSNIPIIALTASVVRSDLKKCIDAGMNSYLAKPFRKEELIREIGKVLHRNTRRTKDSDSIASDKSNNAKPETPKMNAASEITHNTNLTKLYDLYGSDHMKIRGYLIQFLEIIPERLSHIKQMAVSDNRDAIYHAAHRLKPQLGFFGMVKEELLANTIEMKAKEIDISELQELIEQLEEGCNLAFREIEHALHRLS